MKDDDEEESKEKITELVEEKNKKSIKEKRSFFVRMVRIEKLNKQQPTKFILYTCKLHHFKFH